MGQDLKMVSLRERLRKIKITLVLFKAMKWKEIMIRMISIRKLSTIIIKMISLLRWLLTRIPGTKIKKKTETKRFRMSFQTTEKLREVFINEEGKYELNDINIRI